MVRPFVGTVALIFLVVASGCCTDDQTGREAALVRPISLLDATEFHERLKACVEPAGLTVYYGGTLKYGTAERDLFPGTKEGLFREAVTWQVCSPREGDENGPSGVQRQWLLLHISTKRTAECTNFCKIGDTVLYIAAEWRGSDNTKDVDSPKDVLGGLSVRALLAKIEGGGALVVQASSDTAPPDPGDAASAWSGLRYDEMLTGPYDVEGMKHLFDGLRVDEER